MQGLRTLALVAGMAAAAASAWHFTPRTLYTQDYRPAVTLDQLIPRTLGEWQTDPASDALVVNPAVAAHLSTIYTDVLSRIYVDAQGNRVMLSLAYGADQGRLTQVHKPEVCYSSQGFQLGAAQKLQLDLGQLSIPAMRIVATAGPRTEPITYWIRTGDYIVRGWLEQNVARVKNGFLKGTTPDGILVRVSTIDADEARSYAIQSKFLSALVHQTPAAGRQMLIGPDVPVAVY